MLFRYTPLQNHASIQERELEASFDTDDSEVEGHEAVTESRLYSSRSRSHSPTTSGSTPYNFENPEYDYPPPGSPPRPTAFALPDNLIGNSNGLLPQSTQIPSLPQRTGWLRRVTETILPIRFTEGYNLPVGGGIENDGVFANINAKPTRGRLVQDDRSGIHVVPEQVQKDAPPSYASAQADAVPPYWETTIHAPTSLTSAGEMMVDGLPTGSFFSFLWNLLVSMSFQFVGFLLTFLLHSTHAAKLGSRAGLGITLIHYGFYLRTRANTYGDGGGFLSESHDDETLWWSSSTAPNGPKPTFGTAAEAEGYYGKNPLVTNATLAPTPSFPPVVIKPTVNEGTIEWISFLLMTIGWFILLTSTLSFWRVKRWEHSIIASTPAETTADAGHAHAHNPFHALERFGFPGAMWRGLRGGPSSLADQAPDDEEAMLESDGEQMHMLPRSDAPDDIDGMNRLAEVLATDRRLQRDLRAAGLL